MQCCRRFVSNWECDEWRYASSFSDRIQSEAFKQAQCQSIRGKRFLYYYNCPNGHISFYYCLHLIYFSVTNESKNATANGVLSHERYLRRDFHQKILNLNCFPLSLRQQQLDIPTISLLPCLHYCVFSFYSAQFWKTVELQDRRRILIVNITSSLATHFEVSSKF